jgi:ornithine lipid ester-linked acyl 2-hydroxylase
MSITNPKARADTSPSDPIQTFGTDGLKPMERSSAVARFFMALVAWVERLNLKYTTVGNPSIYDNAVFPWVAEIEREWLAIRTELDRLLVRKDELPGFHEISSDVSTVSQDRGWKTFLLAGYGLCSEQNVRQCPETWRIVRKIPGLKTAMFSILEPGKHLPAHRGPYNGLLRLHLGLIVPEPREHVAIRVGSEVYHWQEGRAVVFDDAYDHEAWNRTAHVRVVLFIDFLKPLRFPANVLNWLMLSLAVFTPFIREGQDNQRKWEKRFYAEAEALRNR